MKVKILKNSRNYWDVNTKKPVYGIEVEIDSDGMVHDSEFTKQGLCLGTEPMGYLTPEEYV